MPTPKYLKAEELSYQDLSRIQDRYLKAFDNGTHITLDRTHSAMYNTRLWYAAVTEYLIEKFNKTGDGSC